MGIRRRLGVAALCPSASPRVEYAGTSKDGRRNDAAMANRAREFLACVSCVMRGVLRLRP